MEPNIQLRWLGNAGLQFEHKNILVVDPFLSRPVMGEFLFSTLETNSALQEAILPECDYILITHAHYDHMQDAPAIAYRTGAQVYGDANTCRLMEVLGVKPSQLHEIGYGERFNAGNFQITAIEGHHPWLPGFASGKVKENLQAPLRARDYRMKKNFSFLLETNKLRLLVWSSTRTAKAVPADVLFMRAVSSECWYRDLLERVQPKIAIPTHWDDLMRPLSEPTQLFFGPPKLAWPPLQRVNLDELGNKVHAALPSCRLFIPERLRKYDLDALLNDREH